MKRWNLMVVGVAVAMLANVVSAQDIESFTVKPEDVTKVSVEFHRDGSATLRCVLTAARASEFMAVTTRNLMKKLRFVINGKVVSELEVRGTITDGSLAPPVKTTEEAVAFAKYLMQELPIKAAETKDTSEATPQDAARTFVAAMGSGDVDTAKKSFPSEEEFMAIFKGDKLEQKYKEFRNRFSAAVNTVMPEMAGASFVRLDLRMSSPSPIEVAAGKEIADGVTLKDATMGIDNARIWVEVNGVQREMYVGPMIRVGKLWRILNEVELYPARPKR